MYLIVTLIALVAILTILSGISTLFGSKKKNRAAAAWFFIATIGLALWSTAIGIFLSLNPSQIDTARILIVGIILGITIADIGILGYTCWEYKIGKVLLAILGLVGVFIIVALIKDPSIFYSEISLNNECNRIILVKGWYYFTLMIYYAINTFTFLTFLAIRIRKTSNHNLRTGRIVFYIGLAIGGICCLLFDLIFLSTIPEYIWVGPVSLSITMLCYYYAIVRFKVIELSARWMKILSNVIFALAGVSVYLILFYIVFTALFRIPNPSGAVVLLNVIMAAILITLIPAIREIYASLYAICSDKLEFDYVVRKINNINRRHVNLKELSQFLADNMHYSYVIFIVDGKTYGSSNIHISAGEIVRLSEIKIPNNSIWQETNESTAKILDKYKASHIGVLLGHDGKPFGQVILGKKTHRIESTRKNLIEYETIINLSALVIDDGGRSKS